MARTRRIKCEDGSGSAQNGMIANLRARVDSHSDALWAIANMQITENTDKSEVLELCMSIARIELEKCSTAGEHVDLDDVRVLRRRRHLRWKLW